MSPRKQAAAAGLLTYTTGVPCRRGHLAPRRTTSGQCTACDRHRRSPSSIRSPLPPVPDRPTPMQPGCSYYFTGKPCKRGHLAWRSVATRACMECHRIASARSYIPRAKLGRVIYAHGPLPLSAIGLTVRLDGGIQAGAGEPVETLLTSLGFTIDRVVSLG